MWHGGMPKAGHLQLMTRSEFHQVFSQAITSQHGWVITNEAVPTVYEVVTSAGGLDAEPGCLNTALERKLSI